MWPPLVRLSQRDEHNALNDWTVQLVELVACTGCGGALSMRPPAIEFNEVTRFPLINSFLSFLLLRNRRGPRSRCRCRRRSHFVRSDTAKPLPSFDAKSGNFRFLFCVRLLRRPSGQCERSNKRKRPSRLQLSRVALSSLKRRSEIRLLQLCPDRRLRALSRAYLWAQLQRTATAPTEIITI